MNKTGVFFITLTLAAIIFISCGVKKLIETDASTDMKNKPIKKSTTIDANEPDLQEKKELPKQYDDQGSKAANEEREKRAKENYFYFDENGVLIEKKNGMLITTMPNGEKYYVPDEF